MGAHRETTKHHEAFEAWWTAGRDAPKVAESFQVNERTVREWAERYDWHARADKRDQEAARRADQDAIRRRAAMLVRHRQAAELMQRRGIEHFAKHEIEKASDATSAIKAGVELERQVEGLPSYVVEILNANESELRRIESELDARRRAALAPGPESAGDLLASSGNGKHGSGLLPPRSD